MRMMGASLVLLKCFFWDSYTGMASERASPFSLWKGEYLREEQGGFYLKMKLLGFSQTPEELGTYKISVFFRNAKTRERFSLDYHLEEIKSHPQQIWKAKIGYYLLEGVTIIDKKGTKKKWFPKNKRLLQVWPLGLSNMGLWFVRARQKDRLSVKIRMATNTFRESKNRSSETFATIVDGLTGRIQKRLKGKKFRDAAAQDFSEGNTMRSDISQVRQILMVYRINLGQYNRLSQKFNSVLALYDDRLRTCYTDLLDEHEVQKLRVRFQFRLNKSTGVMEKIDTNSSQFPTVRLRECLYYLLSQMQFPFRMPIKGDIEFIFGYKG